MADWRVGRSEDRKTGRLAIQSSILPFYHSAILSRFSAIVAGGLFIASFSLYLSALAPSVVTLFDDSLEFQLVTYQLGIAHPTGYPLYTLLGKFFTFLPVGNVAYRVNLMSAVFGAATVTLLYLLILQLAMPKDGNLEGQKSKRTTNIHHSPTLPLSHPPMLPIHLGAILGAMLLAVGQVFWQQATIAEVYTLNAFFVAGLLWLAVILSPPHQSKSGGALWLAFLAGLSLTHHRTILLLLPALALYLYLTHRPIPWLKPGSYKTLLLAVLVGLAPLLLYLYLPWRGHVGSLDGTYQNTWTGFWRQISGSGYSLFIFENPFGQERQLADYWRLLQSQFYTVGPGLTGIFYLLWAGQYKKLALTGLAFLSYTTFNLFYQVSDIEVFFIPVFLIWAIWSGVGIAFLFYLVISVFKRWQPILSVSLAAIFVFMIVHLIRINYPLITQDYTWQVHDYGLDILQQPLPLDGQTAIVGILGEMTLLRYFQQTENQRPDIQTIAADLEADRLAAIEKLLAQGKSVYLTRELPGAAERWSLNAVGPLIRVNLEPLTTPPEFSFALKQAITSEIMLLGYDLSRPPHTDQGPAPLRLTLFWQAAAPIRTDLKVSARLLNSEGEVITAVDAVPVHFAYPTTAWRPGEIVADVYDLVLPVGISPGPYTPLLIWYDPTRNAAEVGRVELEPVIIN